MILVVFLGFSLADEIPGFFRDKPVLPNKLRLGLWKKYKARDQHESKDIRTMNTKQTEESSDIEVRHKLPIQDTAWFSHENDDTQVTPYCHSKIIPKYLPNDGSWTPAIELQYETICDPNDDLPSDQIAIIDEVAHQKCETQYPHYYCFTREEEVTFAYKLCRGRGCLLKPKKITLRKGCRCAAEGLRKR